MSNKRCATCAHDTKLGFCEKCWRAHNPNEKDNYVDMWEPKTCPTGEQDEYFTERPDRMSKKVIDGKVYLHDGCDGCAYMDRSEDEEPCMGCKSAHLTEEAEYYKDMWMPADDDSDWTEAGNQAADRFVDNLKQAMRRNNQTIVDGIKAMKNPVDSQSAKADAGKPRITLVPRRIIWDIAAVRQYGVEVKYPETGVDGWRTIGKERIRDAMCRHMLRYLEDPDGVDEESGLPHLWHVVTNGAFLCELEDSDDNP